MNWLYDRNRWGFGYNRQVNNYYYGCGPNPWSFGNCGGFYRAWNREMSFYNNMLAINLIGNIWSNTINNIVHTFKKDVPTQRFYNNPNNYCCNCNSYRGIC